MVGTLLRAVGSTIHRWLTCYLFSLNKVSNILQISNIQKDVSDAKLPQSALYSFALVQNFSKYLLATETFVQVKFHLEASYEKQLGKRVCVSDQ